MKVERSVYREDHEQFRTSVRRFMEPEEAGRGNAQSLQHEVPSLSLHVFSFWMTLAGSRGAAGTLPRRRSREPLVSYQPHGEKVMVTERLARVASRDG